VLVRRDGRGVPSVEASCDEDVWFGLGFCHGQDRAFQLEAYLRAVRGTLAELVGPEGLAVDRLSRRVGFRRAAERQFAALDADLRARLDAYVAGVAAGQGPGSPRRPHELVLLRATPTAWAPADVLGFLKLQSFIMPANWDAELARHRLLRSDGPEALAALDPVGAADAAREAAPGGELGRLAEDVAALTEAVRLGGGSNAWAVSGERTASGRPILANDPHLPPTVPSPWYLARLRRPTWAAASATLVGGPALPIGFNGRLAWGSTAGLVDNTDLFLEKVGPDGLSVLRARPSCPARPARR
jgi:penicillin amidase